MENRRPSKLALLATAFIGGTMAFGLPAASFAAGAPSISSASTRTQQARPSAHGITRPGLNEHRLAPRAQQPSTRVVQSHRLSGRAAAHPQKSSGQRVVLGKLHAAPNGAHFWSAKVLASSHRMAVAKHHTSGATARLSSSRRIPPDTTCTEANNTWVGFSGGNKDINLFYDNPNGSGPIVNNCETQDLALTINASGNPSSVTVPGGTTATVNDTLTVKSGGTLTITGNLDDATNPQDILVYGSMSVSSGSSVFMSGHAIYVENGGSFTASGATLRGPSAQAVSPGTWEGLDFYSGSTGTLSSTNIYSAGSGFGSPQDASCSGGCDASVAVEGSAAVSITGGTIGGSAGNGIEVDCHNDVCADPTIQSVDFNYGYGQSSVTGSGFPIRYDFIPGDLSSAISGLTAHSYSSPFHQPSWKSLVYRLQWDVAQRRAPLPVRRW